MTPNKNIFCNTPWYELHIYWDGSLGICSQESRKLYDEADKQYNIQRMTIKDWFNSEPVRNFRKKFSGNSKIAECTRCYLEESNDGNSRRLRTNQKSVLFTGDAFEESFVQSPGYPHFKLSQDNDGYTDTLPLDLHIDLGNVCNLACKMCRPEASSTIASQHVVWGIKSDRQFLGTDWTRNTEAWNKFKQECIELPGLNNIHFMGGETFLTDRFENFVDTMIEHKRFDLCFSFVTNGTVFRADLIEKLKLFRRVGMEVSIETLTPHNSYVRQGTDTELVLSNIKRYIAHCNNSSVTLALRPALSLLTVGNYITLLEYALEKQLIVKSNLCYKPNFLNIAMLPDAVKLQYQEPYRNMLTKFDDIDFKFDYNVSDPHEYRQAIKQQLILCLNLLQTERPETADAELDNLVNHCKKWDDVYGYNALELYPELAEEFIKRGY